MQLLIPGPLFFQEGLGPRLPYNNTLHTTYVITLILSYRICANMIIRKQYGWWQIITGQLWAVT